MEQIPVGSHNGIEANDLVSLLCRFEEATKPAQELMTQVLIARPKPLQTVKNNRGTHRNGEGAPESPTFVSPMTSVEKSKEYSSLDNISKCETVYPTNPTKTNYNNVQKLSLLKKSIISLNNDGLQLPNCVESQNKLKLNVDHLIETKNIRAEFVTVNQVNNSTNSVQKNELVVIDFDHVQSEEINPDHSYCFSTISDTNSVKNNSVSWQVESEDINCLKNNPLFNEVKSQSFETIIPSKASKSTVIIEEGQVFIDTDGNDLQISEPAQSTLDFHEISSSDQENCTLKRKMHGNGKQNKLNHHNSCAEEDGKYFEKIPSYYTALSIPSKPVKTTVFESAATSVGRDDHIDLLDRGENFDELQFNKVPAHRRCFTNTIKEVDIDTKSFNCSQDEDLKNREESLKYSYSRSPSPHDTVNYCSLSPSRYSRSQTRGSFRSSSVSSDRSSCSTCSSVSYCSTCNNSGRSRSRSLSSCSSCSNSPVRRISRSRSPSLKRKKKIQNKKSKSSFSPHHDRHSRSRSSLRKERLRSHSPNQAVLEKRKARQKDRENAMEERRVVYVGKIPNDYTKRQLYQRFECFGEIKEVKLNFREHGDNYGFVTFAYACDAIAAKERGNNTSDPVKFDLCFGGRRRFCADQYADLDGNQEVEEEYAPMPKRTDELDFSDLLRLHTRSQNKKYT